MAFATILVLSHSGWAFVCPTTPVYNEKISNLCSAGQLNVLWPNFENVNQYYRCQGAGNAVLDNCFPNTIFDFSQQKCARCEDYVPAPACKELKNNIKCESFTPVTTKAPDNAVAFCYDLAQYTTTFVPNCKGNDVYMHWPNYKNLTSYYWCQGQYNAQLKDCAVGTYFNYYAQICTDCKSYVAAPVCEKLPFDKSNTCEKI